MSTEQAEKGNKWLQVLNHLDTNKLDTNKLEMESQFSVSVSGTTSEWSYLPITPTYEDDTNGGMLRTHHHYPFRASDRQISPRSPKTHYNYDKIRRMLAGSKGQEITDQSITRAAQLILASPRHPLNITVSHGFLATSKVSVSMLLYLFEFPPHLHLLHTQLSAPSQGRMKVTPQSFTRFWWPSPDFAMIRRHHRGFTVHKIGRRPLHFTFGRLPRAHLST